MMLHHPPTEDHHPRLFGPNSHFIQSPDITGDIDDQAGVSEGVEVDHVAEGAVGEGGGEDGDFVLRWGKGF